MSEHNAKQEKSKPDPAPVYRFRVDKQAFETHERHQTGAAILAIAGLDPALVILVRAMKGGVRDEIAPGQTVDLGDPGLERFFTMKNEHTNGLEGGCRDFELLADDEAALEATGLAWEARTLNGERWLFLRGYPVPAGLLPAQADLGLRLSANYPMTEIDMAYFNPPLNSAQPREIPNLAMVPVGDASWQQWSRHRTPNSWRPGVDGLDSHLAFVAHFLAAAASAS